MKKSIKYGLVVSKLNIFTDHYHQREETHHMNDCGKSITLIILWLVLKNSQSNYVENVGEILISKGVWDGFVFGLWFIIL